MNSIDERTCLLPSISVIIPTRKGREKQLEKAIQSVKNQRYPGIIEIIIVNEGKPAPEQRNVGIDRAKGEYIAFLDDDDVFCIDTKLYIQMLMILKYKAVLCTCDWFDLKSQRIKTINMCGYLERYILVSYLNIETSTLLIDKKYIEYFDTDLKTEQSRDLVYRLSKKGLIVSPYIFGVTMMRKGYSDEQISTNYHNKIDGYIYFHKKHFNAIIKLPLRTKLYLWPKFLIGLTYFTILYILTKMRKKLYAK